MVDQKTQPLQGMQGEGNQVDSAESDVVMKALSGGLGKQCSRSGNDNIDIEKGGSGSLEGRPPDQGLIGTASPGNDDQRRCLVIIVSGESSSYDRGAAKDPTTFKFQKKLMAQVAVACFGTSCACNISQLAGGSLHRNSSFFWCISAMTSVIQMVVLLGFPSQPRTAKRALLCALPILASVFAMFVAMLL